jgi:hypothetical protein
MNDFQPNLKVKWLTDCMTDWLNEWMHESLKNSLETEFNLLPIPQGAITRDFRHTFYAL